eukprot:3603427-Pleurochrysis_carterae.AAC.1
MCARSRHRRRRRRRRAPRLPNVPSVSISFSRSLSSFFLPRPHLFWLSFLLHVGVLIDCSCSSCPL